MGKTVEITGQEAPATDTLQELIRRAQEGDRTVLPELQKALDANPQLWQTCGNLARQAEHSWLHLLAGTDLLLYQSVQRQLATLRDELAGSDPSPLEKLLVERIVACWLQTMYADALFAQAKGPQATPGYKQELMKRQESSQKRSYLSSIKQLALVRKLLRPAVSPLDLAMRTVQETRPTGGRRVASVPNLRLADLN